MGICINLQFLQEIKSADLLAYLVLLLAYTAYAWSVNRDFESWKSLFLSFKSDLKSQEPWLGGDGYSEETYNNKHSFSPANIIYPLSFESLPEIIRRGVAEFSWISNKFINNLSLFNERIIAFNSALDHIKKIISADPIMSEKLKDKLNDMGLNKEDIEFDDFKKKIKELKKNDEILYLAENIRRLHRIVHVEIIGNKNKGDKLNYLYFEITKELENILNNFNKKKPFFIRYQKVIFIFSLLLFFLIEIYLK